MITTNNLNKRGIESYLNYVCPCCFNQLMDCKCNGDLFPMSMIMVDLGVQEAVRILNKKGYRTLDSCEGHSKYSNTYISFRSNYGFGESLPLPDGFGKMKKNHAVSTMYDMSLSDECYELQKKMNLDALLSWAESLPTVG